MKLRPPQCKHTLYPTCGCVHPPADTTLVVPHSDPVLTRPPLFQKTEARERKPGRPKTQWVERAEKEQSEDYAETVLAQIERIAKDPTARRNLLMQLDAIRAKGDFAEFCRQAWHVVEQTTKLEWNWHHELICRIMQGIFEDWERAQDDDSYVQRVRNAVLNVPPGSLKSRILCVFFPCWVWLRAPGARFIALSVNKDAAMRDARDSRTLIASDWYRDTFQPDWQIKNDQDAISNYGNTKGGVRISMAQGSEIVGLRGDIVLCDDPNNPKEAESKLVREAVNDLYNTNIHNRVNNVLRSIRIGIQQRTHAEDWTGYVTKNHGVWTPSDPDPNKWLWVVLPAEFEPERRCVTPWGEDPRADKGQSLHPERMTPEWLAAEKKRFGTQKYAGQMQQRPTLAEGGMVKMRWWSFFHYEGMVPTEPGERKLDECDKRHVSYEVKKRHASSRWDFDWTVISLDCANKKNVRGSQFGIVVMSGLGPLRFIRDDRTRRGDILEILKVLEDLCAEYDPDRILVEGKAAGDSMMTLLKDKFQRGKIKGSRGQHLVVVVDDVQPGILDKEARLDSCLPEMEARAVHLLDGAEWLEEFTGEVCGFPLATYDDRPDAVSQALNHMRGVRGRRLPRMGNA